jgi:hypothetical protein
MIIKIKNDDYFSSVQQHGSFITDSLLAVLSNISKCLYH